jgi:hypothetical protein
MELDSVHTGLDKVQQPQGAFILFYLFYFINNSSPNSLLLFLSYGVGLG